MDHRADEAITPSETAAGPTQGSYVMPGVCPACGGELAVVRLECGACGTAVTGRYRASRFARLTAEQTSFLEAFLRSRGNIRKVERELGISYPTVRGRLNALLAVLEITPVSDEDEEAARRRRREILDQLESGALRPEEATRMLRQTGR
jgi:hypothetical protein